MRQSLRKKLRKLNFVIVTHVFVTGPALDLEEYLHDKVASLMFIGHPFLSRKGRKSFFRIYKKGNLVKKHESFNFHLPELLIYLKNAFYTFFWILSQNKHFDYYIGSDNFDAFLGLILQRIGKVDNVILYTIDYVRNRFSNVFLNRIYHFFDKQCLENCKVVWNLSDKMAEAREEFDNLKRKDFVPQLIVPVGIWHDRIPKIPYDKRKKYKLVFVGHLLEKQGLDVVINSLPDLIKVIPKLHLLIIGTGTYEKHLKDLVKRKKLGKSVSFSGYVENHTDVERMLAESSLAIAMYKPDPESFTYFADPGKIKNYLSAGLPVILTAVPPIAKELVQKQSALISEYNEEDFVKKVLTLLKNPKGLQSYSENAVNFAKQFDWNLIFEKALSQSV